MFEFKKISKDELSSIIRNAAFKKGVNETTIEKDYWVCFILNYLFTKCKWKDTFTFKGGTSLSKCYNLIKRFSEDIDLILDWQVLGYDINEPWLERTNTKQDKFNKEVGLKTEIFLKDEFLPVMRTDLKDLIDDEFKVYIDENEPQVVLFEYPKTFTSAYLVEAIRLEIGALAAWTPSKVVGMKPDLYDLYPALFEGDTIDVRTVLPERTFWEKATILHHEANRPNHLVMPKRYARHYYDLFIC